MRSWSALAFFSSLSLAAASTNYWQGYSYSGGVINPGGFGDSSQQPIGHPGTCNHYTADPTLESSLRAILGRYLSNNPVIVDAAIKYYITVIQESTTLIEIIHKSGCDQPDVAPTPTPTPGPDPSPQPKPDGSWWNCADRSPCKWLGLQTTEKALPASGSDQRPLPHPNADWLPVSNYKYPFDTWVTASSGALQVYINGKKVQEQGDGNFLIPAGTPANEVKYKSTGGANIQFYGACSKDTPCLGRELQGWKAGATYATQRDLVIDIGDYDYDVILTIADTSKMTEQYTVLVDGKEVDKTHGPSTLGAEKYDPEHIPMTWVAEGELGSLECITHGGYWGSFRIPKGTEKVTVHLEHFEAGWPDYRFGYRLDKLCQC